MDLKAWFGVFVAFFATFSWRFIGLVLAERISSTGSLMRWINAIAYSMVAGVLMLILVNPTGILLTASLSARLSGLFISVFLIYVFKNIPLSMAIGVCVFVFVAGMDNY